MTQNPFLEAIETSQQLIQKLEASGVSDSELENEINGLLQDMATARGFFVALLTEDWNFGDEIPHIIIKIIERKPGHAYELLTKNLVMSTASRVDHERNDKPDLAFGSRRVTRRSMAMIQGLNNAEIKSVLKAMSEAVNAGLNKPGRYNSSSEFGAFLERWNYDTEQLQAMAEVLGEAIGKLK